MRGAAPDCGDVVDLVSEAARLAGMDRVVRGPIVTSNPDRSASYWADGALASDEHGRIAFVGDWVDFTRLHGEHVQHRKSMGLILPSMFDLHTHIPQWPIRGRFVDGVAPDDPRGLLLAGLATNVFPAEVRFDDVAYAEHVTRQFMDDCARNGVIGGCAFLTVHPAAARRTLELLPETWRAGLCLMNQNCPPELRCDASILTEVEQLARDFGDRFVVTDRFAVATTSALRRPAADIAKRYGLMTQTHLNEQVAEKALVEKTLYPQSKSYTHVYLDDGFFDTRAIVAHCIQMTDPEWEILRDRKCVIAHCPTSNRDLGSGVMRLDDVISRAIDYVLCTDVGASPTTSLLAEMRVFMAVHRPFTTRATPAEALYRATLAPAKVLGIDRDFGSLRLGSQMRYHEAPLPAPASSYADAESALMAALRLL